MNENRAVARPRVRLLFAVSLALVSCGTVAQAAAPLALGQRLLKAGELTGFGPLPPTTYRNALEWAASEGPGNTTEEQHWLERNGFVAGTYEQLATPKLSSRTAASYVAQFRTAAGARADLVHELGTPTAIAGVKVYSFRVPGIPGAHGLAHEGPRGKRYNVIFVDGPFSYGVAAFTPNNKNDSPTAAQVARAAFRLYQRVHGAPA